MTATPVRTAAMASATRVDNVNWSPRTAVSEICAERNTIPRILLKTTVATAPDKMKNTQTQVDFEPISILNRAVRVAGWLLAA